MASKARVAANFMNRYSAFGLLRGAFNGQKHWQPAWRDPEPKASYDIIIIGGGGHGLATAYYLAKVHGLKNIAVLEKGWIGGGNTGRNTTIVRSNYRLTPLHNLFEFGLKMWEHLSDELNYNVMFSPRGAMFLGHSDADMTKLAERGDAMRCSGIDADLMTRDQVAKLEPLIDMSRSARFPVEGGLIQRRGGTARHDAVAWGYARAADRLGVDIIQKCEVTGFVRYDGAVVGVETTRGTILLSGEVRKHSPVTGGQQDAAGREHPSRKQGHGEPVLHVEAALERRPAEPASSPAQQISEKLGRALAESGEGETRTIASTAVKSLTITLQPDRLGAVQVSLTLQAEGLHVRIIASETATADMLRQDRHQLDGLLQPLAGDAQASQVTVSIESAQEGIDASILTESESSPRFETGPSDYGSRRPRSDANGTPSPGKGESGNHSSEGMMHHEDIALVRRRLPGVIVV